MRKHGSPCTGLFLLFLLLTPLVTAVSGNVAVSPAHAHRPAFRHGQAVPSPAACAAASHQHCVLKVDSTGGRHHRVEARPPHNPPPTSLSRQAWAGSVSDVQQTQAKGARARLSPLTCQQERKGKHTCKTGWAARLPPHQRSRPDRADIEAQAGRHQLVQVGEGTALPTPNLALCMVWADSPSSSDAMAVWDQRSDSYPSGSQAPL